MGAGFSGGHFHSGRVVLAAGGFVNLFTLKLSLCLALVAFLVFGCEKDLGKEHVSPASDTKRITDFRILLEDGRVTRVEVDGAILTNLTMRYPKKGYCDLKFSTVWESNQ